jgi:hypothetical protein
VNFHGCWRAGGDSFRLGWMTSSPKNRRYEDAPIIAPATGSGELRTA